MIISSWAVRVRKKRRNSSVGRRTQAPHPPLRRYSLQWNVLFTLYIQVYNWLRLQQWRTERNGKKNRLFGRKPTVYLEGRRSCVDSRNVIWIARRRFQIAEVAWPRPTRKKKKNKNLWVDGFESAGDCCWPQVDGCTVVRAALLLVDDGWLLTTPRHNSQLMGEFPSFSNCLFFFPLRVLISPPLSQKKKKILFLYLLSTFFTCTANTTECIYTLVSIICHSCICWWPRGPENNTKRLVVFLSMKN